MAKFQKKIEARKMRKQGVSIIKIANQLSVSKSIVSLWCRDILLSAEQKEVLVKDAFDARMKGRLIGAEINRKKRIEVEKNAQIFAAELLGSLTTRDLLIAGIALYWAEGCKDRRFIFVNSDPKMILLMYKWLRETFQLPNEAFMPRVSINEIHKPRIERVLAFWSNLLGLPVSQFGNPWFIRAKTTKVYENFDVYNGILRLGVKNPTSIQYRVLSLIKVLSGTENLPV